MKKREMKKLLKRIGDMEAAANDVATMISLEEDLEDLDLCWESEQLVEHVEEKADVLRAILRGEDA